MSEQNEPNIIPETPTKAPTTTRPKFTFVTTKRTTTTTTTTPRPPGANGRNGGFDRNDGGLTDADFETGGDGGGLSDADFY